MVSVGSGVHSVGKGKVYAGQSLTDVFAAMRVQPDFDYTKPRSDSRLLFVHRNIAGGDLYFVDNRGEHQATVDASFRVEGKVAELWHPETGMVEPVSYKIAGGHTTVPLRLEPWGTVFVIFRKATTETAHTLPKVAEAELATIDGPWKVNFQADRDAPASTTLDKLTPWNESADEGVKYFSGNGTYTKTINASADWWKKDGRVWLDLGDVKNLAEVKVNGQSVGTVWHAPYRIDVTKAMKPGANELSIQVTNLGHRLIGDQEPNAKTKYTMADVKPYKATSPLLPSGLMGPVKVLSVANVE